MALFGDDEEIGDALRDAGAKDYVEGRINVLKEMKGVRGVLLLNCEGLPLRWCFDDSEQHNAYTYLGVVNQLVQRVQAVLASLDKIEPKKWGTEENELKCLRLRSKKTMERFEVALGEVRNSVSLKAASLEKARVDLRSLASLRTAAQHRSDTVAARRDAAANECPDIERLLRRSRLLEESAQERHRHAVDCLSAARERLAHFSDSPAA